MIMRHDLVPLAQRLSEIAEQEQDDDDSVLTSQEVIVLRQAAGILRSLRESEWAAYR